MYRFLCIVFAVFTASKLMASDQEKKIISVQQAEITSLKERNKILEQRIERLEKVITYQGKPIINESGVWQGPTAGLRGEPGPNNLRMIHTPGKKSCREVCDKVKLRCVAAWGGVSNEPHTTEPCQYKPAGALDCLCIKI